jgi:predicted SprT family Zn-dependent metalloprotease
LKPHLAEASTASPIEATINETVEQQQQPPQPEEEGVWTRRLRSAREAFRSKRQLRLNEEDISLVKKDKYAAAADTVLPVTRDQDYYHHHEGFRELGRRSVLWSILLSLLRCFGLRY